MRRFTATPVLLLMLVSLPTGASDHVDGPATTQHRVTDLTDLYAFPTPNKIGFLTIILDAYAAVAPNGHFSDKVDYTIYVRRAALRTGASVGVDTHDEVAIRCTFVTPEADDAHTSTCRTDAGLGATVQANQLLPLGATDGFRLFTGRRSDPFFFNAAFAAVYASKGKLLAPRNQDLISGLNTLTVVIDVEVSKLFPAETPSLLALAAASTTRDTADGPIRHLDRIGRPEISNISLIAHEDEVDLRDAYNAEPPFAVPADHVATYRERIAKNLLFFDKIDGQTDWTDVARSAMSELLVDDFLIVDVSRPCDQPSFLEIERSLLTGAEYQTCGGRKPTDDVMDILFGLYTGGVGGPPIRDGVDSPGGRTMREFPWLAAPDDSQPSAIKTFLTNRLLSSSE